jgi:hypothetical protein
MVVKIKVDAFVPLKVVTSEKVGGSVVASTLSTFVWGCGDGRSFVF